MASIFNDPSVLSIFSQGKPYNPAGANGLCVEVIDWFDKETPISKIIPVPELSILPNPIVRIVFAPLDLPSTSYVDGLLWLLNHYSIPSAFIEERIRSTTHSFAALDDMDGYNYSWIHYLCKNITITKTPAISDPRPEFPHHDHADGTWIRSGFILRWRVKGPPQVTLICFEASDVVEQRLRCLSGNASRDSIVQDPFCLFVLVLKGLAMQMDGRVYDILDVFRGVELKILTLDKHRESFTGLHNISKHIIYLQESSEAILLTMKSLLAHHESIIQRSGERAVEHTHRMLVHTEGEFQAVNLRLKGLGKRMDNVIALSFHLVTQESNRIMQSDSNSMATIAFVTLVFLPITTISTIFGSQFFTTSNSHLTLTHDFWIFWVISIPLTAAVVVAWYAFFKKGAAARGLA